MELNLESIIWTLDSLMNSGNVDDATQKSIECLKQSLTDLKLEAQNTGITFSLTGNVFEDVEKLSKGLDQLCTVYTDVKNKEDFDWSSILNNEEFEKSFSMYKDEYDNFIHTVSNAPSDIEACQSAFNELAGAYIYGSGALDGVTQSTKSATIAMLEQMGITNADEIVRAQLAAQELYLKLNMDASNTSIYQQIAALVDHRNASAVAYASLFHLVAQEKIFSNTGLNCTGKILELEMLARSFGIVADSVYSAQAYIDAARFAGTYGGKEAVDEVTQSYYNRVENQIVEKFSNMSTSYKPDYHESGSGNPKTTSSKSPESKTTIDWIEKKLDRLQKKIDATKSKFDNLFTVKKKANNIDTQISQTEALLKATEKAAKKYKQYADKAELSKDLKKKVRDGDYNISDYSSGTADAINKYEGYYNKYKDLQKQAEELETDIRKKEEEKYRLYVDQADAKLEKSEAEAELVGKTYKEQAKYLKEQKKQIKDSYEYQIKIAERNGDKTEAAKLRAQQKKELRDKDVEGYRLRVDKQDAKLERSKAREALDEGNYKKQNVHLEYQKTFLEESYKWKIKIAKTNKDDIEAEKLKAELEKEIRDLTKAEFDNIEAEYDNRIRHTKDQMDIVNSQMEQLEAKGYVASRAFYSQLIAQENKNLSLLKEERKVLQDQMNAGLKDGSIVEGTTAWYEMLESINDVDNATIQATTALIEYNNQLRQLEWDAFDRTQDYISEIQNESDFLLELISSKKLYDDSGQWTPYANAAAGLHAVSYNTYLSQADDYAREIEKINRQLADDPYNTALIKRKQELIHAQQEAMQELVSDGYSAMTNALQKLVDKRKELLNSEKDLYDYEKKISAQTKEILNLEKQKLSLQGDDSEETQAKIQQITMKLEEARDDLEESEYEQWRADQEQLLDSLVDTVQEWVNQRLDNLEGLVSDVIASTNVNASDIRSTLIQAGQDVGYKLTDEMEKIWDTSSTIVSTYGDSFSSQLTAVNTTLAQIRDFVSSMQLNSEKETIENTETNTGSGSHSKGQGSFNASANTMHTEAVSQSGSHYGSSSFSTVSGIRGEQPFKHTPTAERIHTADKVQLLADAVRNLPAAGETVQHMAADPSFAKSDSFVHMPGISYTPEYTRFHEENRHIDNVNVNFTLPNISNYEEFSSSLIRDKSFERAIQNMTFGNALGRNSLNKFRI